MTTYRKLTIEMVVDTLKRAGLSFHVAGVSPIDGITANVTLNPIMRNGRQVENEASSAGRALAKAGAEMCMYSIRDRRCQFRIQERGQHE
jgi:hypothetical protein